MEGVKGMARKDANSRCKEITNTLYSKSIILKVEDP